LASWCSQRVFLKNVTNDYKKDSQKQEHEMEYAGGVEIICSGFSG